MKKFFVTTTVALTLTLSMSGAAPLKQSVTWKNIQSHPAPSPVIGQLSARPSELSRESLWSVGSETLDRDFAKFDNYIKYVGSTGVGYARLQSGWAKSEPRIGEYNFGWIDHQVDGLLEQGVHPWLCLCYGNPAYTSLGYDLNAGIFGDGPVMDGWLKYVKKVVGRFKGKVTMYEVWNEPDGAKPANGVKGESWREYANLFVRTARAIKSVDPDAKIAAFGAFSINKDYFRNGLEEIRRLGGIELVDYVTYHAYWPVPERIIQPVKKLQALCAEMNPSIRVLQGECGCPAQLEYGHAMCNIEWTEYSQAKWDLRHMLCNFSMGVPSSVFTMVDLNYGWMMQSYGLIRMNLRSEPQYLRPKYYAVQHVTSLLTADFSADDSVKAGRASIEGRIRVVGLKKGGRTVGCLLWLGGERPTDGLDRRLVDLKVSGMKLSDPVYVDLLTGYVHDISRIASTCAEGTDFKGLPVWDCPVAIIERTEVKMQ